MQSADGRKGLKMRLLKSLWQKTLVTNGEPKLRGIGMIKNDVFILLCNPTYLIPSNKKLTDRIDLAMVWCGTE